MRIARVLLIVLGAAACGKKSAPKSPASTTQASPDRGSAVPAESAAPAGDSAPQPTTKSDPEEGGQ